MHEKSDPNELTITIDSGASENVISEEFAPQVKVRASQHSPEGVRYVTADGVTMSYRGEKHIQPQVNAQHAGEGREEALDVGVAAVTSSTRGADRSRSSTWWITCTA